MRRTFDFAVIALFAAALGVVGYGTLVREQPPFTENRPRHPPPPPPTGRQTIQQYPKWFDLYFADRVGYRDVLLDWHHAATDTLGEGDAGKAWVGADGWLYLNVADPDEFRDDRPTLDERLDAWADSFADRADWLKGQGIEYVVLLAPEKPSVHPEHLPGRLHRRPPPEPLAGLTERLKARGVRVVNPLPALLAGKAASPRPLYYREDTHWSPAGARVAYDLLADEVKRTHPEWRPLPAADYRVADAPGEADLRRFVRSAGGPVDEMATFSGGRNTTKDADPAFAARLPRKCRSPVMPPTVYTTPDAGGPPLLVFRDSFGEQLLPFVSSDFRRAAVVLSDTLEPEAVAAERPAMVVQVTVGRKFYLCPPPPPGHYRTPTP